MGRMVALLRAVNVGGRKLPMAELRSHCAGLGWADVATYIQSGNIVFETDAAPAEAEAALEALIKREYGYEAPAVVRTAAEWTGYAPGCPFPDAARDEPNRLMMLLSKRPPAAEAAALIQARAQHGEKVAAAGDAIWIHYPGGQQETKITPAFVDKAVGSIATARNHRTVVTLQDMLQA